MSYFAQPTLGRDQLALIPTTLNDAIPEDHEVRLLDDILQTQDWSSWEVEYSLRRGQPPIPPRVLASVILYGLLRRIRSSRVLEYLTGHNVDFLWLTEGRTIDHTTLCKFRTRFKQPLRRFWPMASMRPARTSWAWNNRGWSSSHRLRQVNRSRRIRPFLLRGLEKVRTEWLWACTAHNLRKLLGEVARLRALFARMSVEVAD